MLGHDKIWLITLNKSLLILQNFTHQSKFSYGVVMEEIKTQDGSGNIFSNGPRNMPGGNYLGYNGPPTTLSGTGIDRMAFLQANITRDNTKFVNGAIVGERNVFQVSEQNLLVMESHIKILMISFLTGTY